MMLHISEAAHGTTEPDRRTAGCRVTLKDGHQIDLDGVSASVLKHLRRTGGTVPIRDEKGQRVSFPAKDIRTIEPYFFPPTV